MVEGVLAGYRDAHCRAEFPPPGLEDKIREELYVVNNG